MFYYVEGTVALIEQELAVIDCGGVGYACRTSQNTCAALQCGKKARLYTYLSVRESACDLYGFAEMEELNCFKMLLSVSGVGPKAALAILSSAPPSQLALSIITGDTKFLTRAPGIGKKIAQLSVGVKLSGVTVQAIIRSMSSAFRPASSSARCAAGRATSIACMSTATRRSRMPVRCTIHSSDVSTICSSI